jgi:Carboxypeptidase regulatory-like domain/TonB dependent receptor-like, beta-barrel
MVRECASKFWKASLFVLLAGVSVVPLARAQSSVTGAVVGAVADKSGAVIPGASVSALNVATSASSSTTTDTSGRYALSNLRPGRYTIQVTAKGFGSYKQENVIVEVGRSTSIDAVLQVAGQATTVVVTGEAPVITTDRPDFSTNINTDFIANLPINGRRWSSFALGTPGAVADGTFGLISFRGISGLLNNNTVDGGDNNQAFFSEEKGRTRISYSVSEDSIQEYQVNTSNFSAEYGRSAGGVVNAVTKSGTNGFHGDAFWYFRDSDLGGAFNPFAKQTALVNGAFQSVPVNPPDKRHQFGGDVGGPIIPNKLFFFFSADQQLRNFPGVAQPSNPTNFFAPLNGGGNCASTAPTCETDELTSITGGAVTPTQAAAGLAFLDTLTGVVPRTGDELVLFPKIDWQINRTHHFSAEYNRMRWSSPAGIQTGGVVNRGIESFGDDFVKDDTAIGRLTSTFGPTLTNQFLFLYGRDFEFEFGQASIAGEPIAPQTGVSPQVAISGTASFTFGLPNFLPRPAFPDETRYQFADTLSWSHGRHLFKFGTDINRVNDLDLNLFEQDGAYSYADRVHFLADYVAATNNFTTSPCGGFGCYSSFAQGLGPLGFEFTTWDLGFFVNDEFRIRPRVTLTLGLRYDYERMPDPQIPNPLLPASFTFPSDKDNLGPRVGFAWDITGKGKSVLRGGYGIFYGRIINSTIFNAIGNIGSANSQFQLSFLPKDPGAPIYPKIIPSLSGAPKSALTVVAFGPDTQNPLIHEFDLVYEQEIARNTAVSVSYLGSIGRNLPIFLDTNLSPATKTATYTVSGGQFNGQTFTVPVYTKPRPNSNFNAITEIDYAVKSHYNAFVVQLNRRLTGGLQVQASYTYANAFDNGQSSTTFTATNNVFDPQRLFLEDGRSNFDLRHRFSALVVWAPEYFRNSGRVAHELLDGFTITPIVTVASGGPVTGTAGFVNAPSVLNPVSFNINGAAGTNRPPWIPRNAFQMPRTADVDLELGKSFPIAESWNFRLFADAFNLFNHVNPTAVNTTLYNGSCPKGSTACTLTLNPTFLTPTSSSSTLGGPGQRQIQIGAKLSW